MQIKPVYNVSNFTVSGITDKRDEDKRQNRDGQQERKQNPASEAARVQEPPADAVSPEAAFLPCHVIGTGKVVSLLNFRAAPSRRQKTAFGKIDKKTNCPVIDGKRLNKVL